GPRDHAEGRRGAGAGGSGGRCRHGDRGCASRAGSHQEGQEGRSRGRRQEEIALLKAIIGLGNPGPKFHGTRHNVGFAVLDELAQRARIGFESAPVEALTARWRWPGGSGDGFEVVVLLAKPMTFMTASGEATGGLLRYFKIDVADLLVVVDEVQLPLGKLRARASGSAGGHNGLKSMIQHVGDEVARLRLGGGRGGSRRDLADHVLAKFEKDEAEDVARMIERATGASEVFIASGIAAVMNQFNGGDPATTEEVLRGRTRTLAAEWRP